METIFFLAHTEANGTLGKSALEALGAATELAKQMGGALIGGRVGQGICTAPVCHGCIGVRSSGTRLVGERGDRGPDVAHGEGCGRGGAPPWWGG